MALVVSPQGFYCEPGQARVSTGILPGQAGTVPAKTSLEPPAWSSSSSQWYLFAPLVPVASVPPPSPPIPFLHGLHRSSNRSHGICPPTLRPQGLLSSVGHALMNSVPLMPMTFSFPIYPTTSTPLPRSLPHWPCLLAMY